MSTVDIVNAISGLSQPTATGSNSNNAGSGAKSTATGAGTSSKAASSKTKEKITAESFAKYVRHFMPSIKAESADEMKESARRARAAARQGTRTYNKEDLKVKDSDNDIDATKAAENQQEAEKAAEAARAGIAASKGNDVIAAQVAQASQAQSDKTAASSEPGNTDNNVKNPDTNTDSDAASGFLEALGLANPGNALLDTAARATEIARQGARFYDKRDLAGGSDAQNGGTALWAMTLSELREQAELYGTQVASAAAERRERLLHLGVR